MWSPAGCGAGQGGARAAMLPTRTQGRFGAPYSWWDDWEEDSKGSRGGQTRSLGLSQPFAEFTLYTENRVHCMVLSRGGTRLDLHFTAMTPWRIGLKRIYRKDLSH